MSGRLPEEAHAHRAGCLERK